MSKGSKLQNEFRKDMCMHTKFALDPFWMAYKQLYYPSFSCECRSMVRFWFFLADLGWFKQSCGSTDNKTDE